MANFIPDGDVAKRSQWDCATWPASADGLGHACSSFTTNKSCQNPARAPTHGTQMVVFKVTYIYYVSRAGGVRPYCSSVRGDLGAKSVKFPVFPSPTSYSQFSFINWRYIPH